MPTAKEFYTTCKNGRGMFGNVDLKFKMLVLFLGNFFKKGKKVMAVLSFYIRYEGTAFHLRLCISCNSSYAGFILGRYDNCAFYSSGGIAFRL